MYLRVGRFRLFKGEVSPPVLLEKVAHLAADDFAEEEGEFYVGREPSLAKIRVFNGVLNDGVKVEASFDLTAEVPVGVKGKSPPEVFPFRL
jgi:hypothetical protein